MRLKLWFLMLLLVGGGIALIYLGGREVLYNRKLAVSGKHATATVINKQERQLYKNSKSRHLTVAFQTEAGQKIQDELMVMPHIYGSAVLGKPIEVLYDPKNPSVFIIGGVADVNYTKFSMGWIFLGLGVFLGWFLMKNPTAGVIKTFTEEDMLDAHPIATGGFSQKKLDPLETKQGDLATDAMFEKILKEHRHAQGKSLS